MAEKASEILRSGLEPSDKALVLAHGAGAGMRSPFMNSFAVGLAARGLTVYRFEFPYMQEIMATGRRRPPDSAAVLERSWKEAIGRLALPRPVIGGKSMGGRVASLVADACAVAGLVCLGYPFHPPGKPDRTRTEHLAMLKTPTLICQGTRDPFGSRGDVASYRLSSAIELCWLEDGNRNLEPRRASGRTAQENWEEAMDRIAKFVRSL